VTKITMIPRPWWEVFRIDRWEAARLHQEPNAKRERAIAAGQRSAERRGLHPVEIAQAVRHAREELLGGAQ
jgi:hypothetical protein